VHIAEQLSTGPSGEALAEEYLVGSLPHWARGLYFAGIRQDDRTGEMRPMPGQTGCLIASACIRPRSPEDEARRLMSVELVQACRSIAVEVAAAAQSIPVEIGGPHG
jgi:hypothetical protein